MKFPILLLLSFSSFISIGSSKLAIQPRADSNDFLVQLTLNISEYKVPNYLVDIIYNQSLGQEVSTQHVCDLYQLSNLTLNNTLEILQSLNISSSTAFSLNSLNHTLQTLQWSFTNFYNGLTSNLRLNGIPLRDALLALSIDVTNFSSGIAYGDPDPWSEFIKGNFTQESIAQASAAAGITLETLFGGVRSLIVDEVVTWDIQNLLQLFLNHSIGKPEAVIIWNTINITMEDVYNVELFRFILGNYSERLNNQTTLGILTNLNRIFINKKSYDLFEADSKLCDINAITLLTNTVVSVSGMNGTLFQNVGVLKHDGLSLSVDNLTTIETAYVTHNLTNCSYVTWQNNVVHSVTVEKAVFRNDTFLIPRIGVIDVIPGSPLICNDTVYGLAREVKGEDIVLDLFKAYQPVPITPTNGARVWNLGLQNAFVLVVIYAITDMFRY